jgi:hypothetical protein
MPQLLHGCRIWIRLNRRCSSPCPQSRHPPNSSHHRQTRNRVFTRPRSGTDDPMPSMNFRCSPLERTFVVLPRSAITGPCEPGQSSLRRLRAESAKAIQASTHSEATPCWAGASGKMLLSSRITSAVAIKWAVRRFTAFSASPLRTVSRMA